MIFFQATVHLKDNKQGQFFEGMQELARLAPAEINFRLFAAYIPVTGQQNTYINIWQAPDANSVVNLPQELAKHPDLAAVFGKVKDCIAEETYELLVAAPYAVGGKTDGEN
jgi:hypothetical protein